MNLWSLLSLAVGAIYLVGFVVLVYCAKHAPEGYEDVDGFRLGIEPVKSTPRSPHTRPPMPPGPGIELADAA